MCVTRKIPHFTPDSAQRAVDDMKRRGYGSRKRIKALHAYKCPHCPNYHVGHSQRAYRKSTNGHAA